jgi:hypothetical protein
VNRVLHAAMRSFSNTDRCVVAEYNSVATSRRLVILYTRSTGHYAKDLSDRECRPVVFPPLTPRGTSVPRTDCVWALNG